MTNKKQGWAILGLSITAAIIYNSWPLGFIVNYPIARIGLASDLEAIGQPYNWLFIILDIMVGIAVAIMVVAIYYKKLPRHFPVVWGSIAGGLSLFGLLTILSAAIPLNCSNSIDECGIAMNQLFGFHDVAGAISSLGLFIGVVGIVILCKRNDFSKQRQWLTQVVLILWSLNGLAYLLFVTSQEAKAIQELFLVISGLAVVAIGSTIQASIGTELADRNAPVKSHKNPQVKAAS